MEQKFKQSVLAGQESIDQLISLTFDESAAVRLEAAKKLKKYIDDPRGIFALIELTSDKNPMVSDHAKTVLDRVGGLNNKAVLDLQLIFSENKGKSEAQGVRERILPKIDELFIDAERKQKFKDSVIPTLDFFITHETMYRVSDKEDAIGQSQQLQGVELPIERIEHERPRRLDRPAKDPLAIENIEFVEFAETLAPAEIEKLPMFKFAYELVSSGLGKKELAMEKKRLLANFKREADLAFEVAVAKFQHGRYTAIPAMKEGMRRIDTEELKLVSSGNVMNKTGKKVQYVRLVLSDGRDTVHACLPTEKGEGLRAGDTVQLLRAEMKRINGELALSVRKTSRILVSR